MTRGERHNLLKGLGFGDIYLVLPYPAVRSERCIRERIPELFTRNSVVVHMWCELVEITCPEQVEWF